MAFVDDVREALEQTVPDYRDRGGDWAGVLAAARVDEPDGRRWSRWAIPVIAPVAAASARLAPAADGKRGRGMGVLRLIRKRPGRTALAFAALAGTTVLALSVSTPWKDSPGFLARAQAALTPPAETILHMKTQTTFISTNPACTVTRGPTEFWIDQAPPYRYRALNAYLPPDPADADSRALVCSPGPLVELGGNSKRTLVFVPPNTLREAPGLFSLASGDTVASLRDAISGGSAHHDGKVQLDGRTVERIRWDPPPGCPVPGCEREPVFAYVDPETFYPIRIESPHAYIWVPGRPVVQSHAVVRFLTYEYLPRTADNLALTDIRAQHPDATGP